ncbi:MAG TPA: aldehyde ferredoxin oxidoreductase N-terminal domain-containing protein [Symbiobacteriaceae bacterium]|nr:aldehyde ferredoxin oxidoreductase N-terminal domain-containing protein [Symbiobacteriaceae bacterium]
MDRILRIDMTDRSWRAEPLPDAYCYLGGRSLTSRMVIDEVDPLCDPLGPNNKLILAPGLLSGTVLSSSSRVSAGAKSPLTGGIKESNAGGQTGMRMAQLGYRAVVLEGMPEAGAGWFTIVVDDQGARFESADDLTGLGTYEAAGRLFEQYGKKAALQLIGPTGERLMNLAGICNTDPEGRPSRLNARGGLGAVMGSKRVKAIVYLDCGYKPVKADDDALWKAAAKAYTTELRTQPATKERYPQFGTAGTLEFVNKVGGLPIRNFSRGQDPETDRISGIQMREVILERGGQTTHSCMTGCAIQCSNVFVDEQGKEMASSMEFETNGLLGSNLEIFDFDWIARFTHQCNDLGVDTIETGGVMGVAAEGGLIPFGDPEAVMQAFGEIRRGTPAGRLLGLGAGLCGKALGVRRVPVVKNQTISAYDPRAVKGNGVTYCTTAMGADHTAGNTIGARTDHLNPSDKVAISRELQIHCLLLDAFGFCSFARGIMATTPDTFTELAAARFGRPFTTAELRAHAVEMLRAEVAWNRRAGLGKETDRLPEWMRLEPLPPHNALFDVSEDEIDAIWENV